MRFHEFYREMALMVDKFVNIPNRVLLYQLYNYVSDMRSVMSMVNSHIKWHGERLKPIHKERKRKFSLRLSNFPLFFDLVRFRFKSRSM